MVVSLGRREEEEVVLVGLANTQSVKLNLECRRRRRLGVSLPSSLFWGTSGQSFTNYASCEDR